MIEKPTKKISEFLLDIMEMLNTSQERNQGISEVLKTICEFACMDCGFVYQADHTGVFCIHDYYKAHSGSHLPPAIDLFSYLGEELIEALSKKRFLAVGEESCIEDLYHRLKCLFQVNSMLLVPITGRDQNIIALIGLADTSGNSGFYDLDIPFAYSILAAAANHIKLCFYEKKESNMRQSMESILNNTNVSIYVNDFYTQEILYANHAMAEPYGGVENMIGKVCWKVLYKDRTEPCNYCPRLKLVDKQGIPKKVYTWDSQRSSDGAWFRVLSSAFQWGDGRLAHMVSSVDISDKKKNEELIRQIAEYDSLTGLPNRWKLLRDSEEGLGEAEDLKRGGYLMFFDLDGFKSVNDQYGHRAGDELLVKIGEFLQCNELTKDKSYRYGGDEFVILCLNEDISFVKRVIEALQERFLKPWNLKDKIVCVQKSIGIAHCPKDAGSASELIHHADMAMYSAKRAGQGNIMFFNQGRFCGLEEYGSNTEA